MRQARRHAGLFRCRQARLAAGRQGGWRPGQCRVCLGALARLAVSGLPAQDESCPCNPQRIWRNGEPLSRVIAVGLWHRLWHERALAVPDALSSLGRRRAFRLLEPHNRKRPGGEPRRVLGLLQGGEICISIYVDPWEVGGPFDVSRADHCGSNESHMCDAGPSQKVLCYLPLIGCPLRILEQHTNVCAVCV